MLGARRASALRSRFADLFRLDLFGLLLLVLLLLRLLGFWRGFGFNALRLILRSRSNARIFWILATGESSDRRDTEDNCQLVHYLFSFLTSRAKTSPRSPKLLN